MAAPKGRDEGGKFESQHDIGPGDVFDAMEPLEPYTTREIADIVGAPRRTVFNYLNELADDELIRKKKPEPRRAIWVRPD